MHMKTGLSNIGLVVLEDNRTYSRGLQVIDCNVTAHMLNEQEIELWSVEAGTGCDWEIINFQNLQRSQLSVTTAENENSLVGWIRIQRQT